MMVMHFSPSIKKLLSLSKNQNEQISFLTFYNPTRKRLNRDELKRVKGYLQSGLREFGVKNTGDSFYEQILEKVITALNQEDDLKKGFAVFGRLKDTKFELDVLETLTTRPQRELYIGNTYDLDQLIKDEKFSTRALVLCVERDKCTIYSYSAGSLKMISTVENDFALKKEKQYLHAYGATQGASIVHSTGDKNLDKREVKENEEFMREVAEYLKEKVTTRQIYPLLLLSYSKNFSDFIDSWAEKYQSDLGNPHIVLIDKVYDSQNDLRYDVENWVRNFLLEKELSTYFEAKEDYYTFVSGWAPVYDAAKLGTVESLFITPTVPQRYQQIAAETVNNVIQASGVVHVLDSEVLDETPSARLRYTI